MMRSMEAERSGGGGGQYRECMHNHAATLGTYATDGCCEYMPDPASLAALKCAACGCHRNFHRKYVAFHGGGGGAVENAMVEYTPRGAAPEEMMGAAAGGKRRTRTKFSPFQKKRMQEFAEEIGWRVHRRDGGSGGGGGGGGGDHDEIARFCAEIGVSRQVFKVWMHNHKNSAASSSSTSIPPLSAIMDTDVVDDHDNVHTNIKSAGAGDGGASPLAQ